MRLEMNRRKHSLIDTRAAMLQEPKLVQDLVAVLEKYEL